MPISVLLHESIALMLIGMGAVFFFLITTMVVMVLLSRVSRHFANVTSDNLSRKHTTLPDKHLVAVITAAIKKYRDTR